MAKIKHIKTVTPKYRYSTEEIIEAADQLWLKALHPTIRKSALKILQGSGIAMRASAFPIEEVFSDLSFEDRNNQYIEAALELGTQALEQALAESNTRAEDLDFIITTSCTGFMIPSLDAYLVNRLHLRGNIVRLPVTEMGCAGGTACLIYAHQLLKANPHAHVAIVSVELPSITFQKNDISMENLVSTAIFADGAAAVILGPSQDLLPEIVDSEMYHFPNSTELMGYQLKNSGLKIVLDRKVPDTIQEHFPHFFYPLLDRHKLKIEDIDHFLFHPGGKKIIQRIDDFISRFGKDISSSKNVLRDHGNMSSATILFILEQAMKLASVAGERGYLLAFGPGFSAHSLLIEWKAKPI